MSAARLAGYVALLSMLAACGGDDAPGTLRSGATEVYTGTVVERLAVIDADRDGDRIALLEITDGLLYAYIELSDDLGKTWRFFQVRRAIVNELGGDSAQIGVHLENGRVYLLLSRDIGSHLPAWAIFDLDPATGEATEIVMPPANTGWFSQRRPDGHLWYIAGGGLHAFADLDPATGQASFTPIPCGGLACDAPAFRSHDGGDTWDGYSQPQDRLDLCTLHYDVASAAATQTCVHRPVWPTANYDYAPTIMFRGATPYMAWSTDDQAYATALLRGSPPMPSETLQLGPGTIDPTFRTGSFVRPRYADFELIKAAIGPGNLARLTDAGPEWVVFPKTPCTRDEGCGYDDTPSYGYGKVQWILPTDQGDYLVFYTVGSLDDGSQTIYMTHEVPSVAPVVGAAPPPVHEVVLPDGAEPMNDLEKACMLYVHCVGGHSTQFYRQCLKHWITESPSSPGLAAARQRFVAAATSCASLDAVAASPCPLECTESGGTCGAGDAGPCSTEVPYVASECHFCDGAGHLGLCSQTREFAVTCGGGTVCSGYGCVLPDVHACDDQPFPVCDGGSVRTCDNASRLVTLADCSLEGASCHDGTSATCGPTSTSGACSPPDFQTQCGGDGTHLLACSYGQIRYVPCTAFGYTECQEFADGALCH